MVNIVDIVLILNFGVDVMVIGVDDDLDDAWTKYDVGYRVFVNYCDLMCD